MTLLVVSFLIMARTERTTSNLAMDRVQGEILADMAADTAVQRLREAIDAGRTFNASQFTTWASEPGRIHIFTVQQGNGAISRTSRDMFSALPGPDTPATPNLNNIDLNEPSLSGTYPITGTVPGTMKVGWRNVRMDPTRPAAADNRVVGRIAYWVDDESCKVNINTADGSHKNDTPSAQAASGKYTFGFGTPSEISLEAFAGMTPALAEATATYAADKNFNSLGELGQVGGLPADFVTQHKFSMTYTSRSPDLNMWGEPRIHLFAVNRLSTGRVVNFMTGPYGGNYEINSGPAHPSNESGGGSDPIKTNVSGGPVDHIYPTSVQLPLTTLRVAAGEALPQHLAGSEGLTNTASNNYLVALRIAKYLQGYNSLGQAITWPRFPGATVSNFAGKYSLRQIDSIVVQMIDLVGRTIMCDQFRVYSMPSVVQKGILGGELVSGVARAVKLTELSVIITTLSGSPPQVQFQNRYEWYLPRYYEGAPMDYFASAIGQWRTGHNTVGRLLNRTDISPSPLGQPGKELPHWMCNLLRFEDDAGNPVGMDLNGSPSTEPDPDQAAAAALHPYMLNTTPGPNLNKYMGINISTSNDRPLVSGGSPWSSSTNLRGPAGLYQITRMLNDHMTRMIRPDATTVNVRGGISVTTHNESGAAPYEFAPLEAMRGPNYSGEAVADIKDLVLNNVIPVRANLTIPGRVALSIRVADPLVNKWPGDWIIEEDPSYVTFRAPNTGNANSRPYMRGASSTITQLNADWPAKAPSIEDPVELDGDNPEFRAAGGGDPLSLWLPRQDIRLPKQARLPSVGALNTLRTGMIPDVIVPNSMANKGVPFRCICFDAATGPGQTTAMGSYPDWAMLDLFTVPFLPQKPVTFETTDASSPYPNPPAVRQLTSGGSTEGRININNPRVPYPFAESIPGVDQTGPERLTPLRALFRNVRASNAYDPSGEPVYTTANEVALAAGVQEYMSNNGPFMLAGQLANVPEVAAYTYRGVAAASQSRNDLFAKVVGACTTQSNTYSVWVVTQTIRKAAHNTNYDAVEPGDQVTSEVRRRYLVERLIEPGKDGVPGNVKHTSSTTGTNNDGTLNSADDRLLTDFHPPMTYPLPYRWRILSVEDVNR
ncbi:hypothetical protein DB346_15855 [Verrucomicrobia bacterium LW23]|nr:hypothetical protein DB346_15855 [Verrucomicrobia bacterium LW23]